MHCRVRNSRLSLSTRKRAGHKWQKHHPIVQPSANPADEVPGVIVWITGQELAVAEAYEVFDFSAWPLS